MEVRVVTERQPEMWQGSTVKVLSSWGLAVSCQGDITVGGDLRVVLDQLARDGESEQSAVPLKVKL